MALPRLIPLSQAAQKMGLSEADLRQRIDAGTIQAGITQTTDMIYGKMLNDDVRQIITTLGTSAPTELSRDLFMQMQNLMDRLQSSFEQTSSQSSD